MAENDGNVLLQCGKNGTPNRQPNLIRFLAMHAAIGAGVAVLVVAGLVFSDTHALGKLIANDESPILAVLLLVFGFVITLGSAAMGAAIMGLPYDGGGGQAGRRKAVVRRPDAAVLAPVRAAVPARR